MRSIIRWAAERAGLDLATVYGFRHSRAQSILDTGRRLEDVAAFLGHHSVTTAAGYAQVRANRVQELTQTLPSPLPAEILKAKRCKKRQAKRTG